MSIYFLNLNNYKQDFSIKGNNKALYGEVHTPFHLIIDMFDMIPDIFFANPNLTWLDPCSGKGFFSIILYKKLFKSLSSSIFDPIVRHNHIITNMIYINEINSEFIPLLKKLFGENSNISNKNFFDIKKKFNFIIGNPPFNFNGLIKTPTKTSSKKKDGKTIWQYFITHSISLLKNNGYLLFITPSIWMKNDHSIFKLLNQYNIIKIKTMNNTQTNKIFNKQAQTPTCYFLIQNKKTDDSISLLYDDTYKKYIKYNNFMKLSLPLFVPSIIQKLIPYTLKYGSLKVKKTNMRPGYKGLIVKSKHSKFTTFRNIKTCKLNNLQPKLIINYSNIPCSYYNKPKLVLAHKMYGFPYLDYSGIFGISNRDNYVILKKSYPDFVKLHKFLSTNFIRTIFEATRYRMSYLEKYIFDIIPDITKINNFPDIITDNTLCNFFNLDELERNIILTFHKKYLSL